MGYKINIQKSIVYLFTNSKTLKVAIYNCISIYEILRDNPYNKCVDLYAENYKILLTEIKDINKLEVLLVHGLQYNCVKMSILPKLI